MLALVPNLAAFGCERLVEWRAERAAVTSAETIRAADGALTHCRVRGTIETSINFELLLPQAIMLQVGRTADFPLASAMSMVLMAVVTLAYLIFARHLRMDRL